MRLPLPMHKDDDVPDTPKFPTADFAHNAAAIIAAERAEKRNKKKKKKKILFKDADGSEPGDVPTLNGVSLVV